jgi:hypothetical protein
MEAGLPGNDMDRKPGQKAGSFFESPISSSARTPDIPLRLGLAGLAACGSILVWIITSHGPGVGNDAVVYLAGARNILAHGSFIWESAGANPQPITRFPPGFSVLLAAFSLMRIPQAESARLIGALCMGLTIFLVGLAAHFVIRGRFFPLLGAALILMSREAITLNSWAMSDGLYLVIAVCWMILAIRRTGEDNWTSPAAAMASLLASAAFLTRYGGVAILLAMPPLLFWTGSRRSNRLRRDLFFFLLLGVMPSVLWLARNLILAGTATDRSVIWNVAFSSSVSQLAGTIGSWFLPGRIGAPLSAAVGHYWVPVAFGLLVLAVAVAGSRRIRSRLIPLERHPAYQPTMVLLAFTIAHLGAPLLSALLTYPTPDLNSRMLAPGYIGVLILLVELIALAWRPSGGEARVALGAILALFVAFKLATGVQAGIRLASDGQGYSSRYWQTSQTIWALKELNPQLLYTDNVGAVYYFTGMAAYNVPVKYTSMTHELRSDYSASYRLMMERLGQPRSALVLFQSEARLPEFPEPSELTKGMVILASADDGAIFARSGVWPDDKLP